MASIFSSFVDSITIDTLLWWLSRATLVLIFAYAFLAVARRARPATRCVVAVGGLFAAAILPVAMGILPSLSLPVLPTVATQSTHAARTTSPHVFAIDPGQVETPTPPVDSRSVHEAIAAAPTPASATTQTPSRASLDWKVVGIAAWITVAMGILFQLGVGLAKARGSARRSAFGNDYLVVECERARRVVGLAHAPEVRVSHSVTIPMVVGTLRPCVLLPEAALTWSPERLRVVLLHEFAHVRRCDGLWMLIARVVTAVFWFHPLTWILARHVRREAEGACDEMVLASGVRGSDYAEHLVAIARVAAVRDSLVGTALTLATHSSLEQRVVSILSTRVLRGRRSRGALFASACGALVLFGLIASVHPTRVASAQITPIEEMKLVDADGAAPLCDVAPATSAEPVIELVTSERFDMRQQFAMNKLKMKDAKYYLAEDKDDDRSGRDWYERASDYYNRERFERAGTAYEKAAELGYRRGTALYNAGCSYALAEQESRAIDALRAAFDEGFDDPHLYAEDTDLNSLRDDPRFKQLLTDVMSSGNAESSRRQATREYERLAKRGNVEDGEWNSVGIDLLRSGDYPRAADAFEHEFKVSHDEDALYNKACARSLEGKSDEALKLLEQSITTGSVDADHMAQDPDLIPIRDEPRFGELVTLAEELELYPDNWWSDVDGWARRGGMNRGWRKAIPHFEEVTRKHPTIGRAWFNLGFAQISAEDPEKAAVSFKRALDLNFQPGTTSFNLACCAAQSDDIDGALTWLERAEKAGMKMWPTVREDDDLDPVRSNPRFKEMTKRWRAAADDEYDHDKYDDHDDEDEDTKSY